MWFIGKKTKVTEPDQSVVEARQLPTAHKIKIAKNIIREFLNIDELCTRIDDTLIPQMEEEVAIADDEWRNAGQPATPDDLAIVYLYKASEIMRASGHMCTHRQITCAMTDIIKNAPKNSLKPYALDLPNKALLVNDRSCTIFSSKN